MKLEEEIKNKFADMTTEEIFHNTTPEEILKEIDFWGCMDAGVFIPGEYLNEWYAYNDDFKSGRRDGYQGDRENVIMWGIHHVPNFKEFIAEILKSPNDVKL